VPVLHRSSRCRNWKKPLISIMVVCTVAVYSLVSPWFNRRASPRAKLSETALVGKPLHLGGVLWEQSPTTLVLAITSHCPYCLRSLPLYRRLDKLAQDGNQGVWLFVVSPESTRTMEAFLSDEQIKPRKILRSSLAEIGVSATPTLLIVDQSGTVRHVFVGQLDEQRERQLMGLLGFKALAAPIQGVSAGLTVPARRAAL
jgi:hypothetical protein